MPWDRYWVISWNVHMSDPERDTQNDRRKGTPGHDGLFRLKPLLDSVKDACRSSYHPRQNLSVDERAAPLQRMKGKPTKWGFKLFALADGSSGYTWDFTVYTGKSPLPPTPS
ncbi:piggyBac transposable element-derived protein 4-like isoform X2 [Cyclopterus lumpus]|uniref:piggyBac transposable element-derived protein 4-like isoform X2 n=1 Tax=Cyclopterus lumpus TaxID=8103 RepID=UPI0014864AC0|nr:piggyBac transposable element-derived protein 4-like isoform X2 [Cyclopterus lumpus]